jgi:hypothetical protein
VIITRIVTDSAQEGKARRASPRVRPGRQL